MDLLEKIRRYESMHIVFWLIKDSCWMLELRWAGAIMIVPTLALAVYLMVRTARTRDFYLNTAIFFWITANSYWMVMELFFNELNKYYAAVPFGLGFVFVGLFYLDSARLKQKPAVPGQKDGPVQGLD